MRNDSKDLQVIVNQGRCQGYLTYDQVNDYLPDEDLGPQKLDELLVALEVRGIPLVENPPMGSLGMDVEPTDAELQAELSADMVAEMADNPLAQELRQPGPRRRGVLVLLPAQRPDGGRCGRSERGWAARLRHREE